MAGYASSLYVPVYAEQPQLEKDMPADKRKWMLHCKTQVSGRSDKNNFVVIYFKGISFCSAREANFHFKKREKEKNIFFPW